MGTFRVSLTGLCAFVPDVFEFGDLPNIPKRVMVLLIDSLPTNPPEIRKGIDSDLLRPHAPVISCNSSDLVNRGVIPENLELRLSFYRKELSFVPIGAQNAFTVIQTTPTDPSDFGHTVHIREIVEESSGKVLVRDECFKDRGSQGLIAGRILLDRGVLATDADKFERNIEFDIPHSLNGSFSQRPLADQARLTLDNVTGVNVVVRDLDSGSSETLAFKVQSSGTVDITVGNLCGDSWLPRRLGTSSQALRPLEDDDFRWFYELFPASVQAIWQRRLGTLPSPRPVPAKIGGGAGLQPVQCMGLALHVQSF